MPVGFFSFGIREMSELLMDASNFPLAKAILTNRVTDSPTIAQFFWWKAGIIPSGPGVFGARVSIIVALTFNSETYQCKALQSAGVILGKLQYAILISLTVLHYITAGRMFWPYLSIGSDP